MVGAPAEQSRTAGEDRIAPVRASDNPGSQHLGPFARTPRQDAAHHTLLDYKGFDTETFQYSHRRLAASAFQKNRVQLLPWEREGWFGVPVAGPKLHSARRHRSDPQDALRPQKDIRG